MPGDPGATVVDLLVWFLFYPREAAGATGTRHSPRPPLFGGGQIMHGSGAIRAARMQSYVIALPPAEATICRHVGIGPLEESHELAVKQGPRYRHTTGESEPYDTIVVEKLTPIIGAEISGVDIGKLVSDDGRLNRQLDEIHRALAENLVIFFRDQHISPEQHLAFGRKFGELHIHPAAPNEGDPALMKIHADKDSPRANGEGWHSDVSCDLEPPMGSILYIKQCPPHGGDTLFASMYAAYEALSDRMKAYLSGLTAMHDGEDIYRGLYANYGVADKPSYPRAEHPVVRTHPVTARKALYVNRGFTRHIVGIPRDESDAILAYLYQHAENPLFQCRFRWTENAIAFWDNRCAQHRAMWDYWPHTRSGTRVTVKGARPV
jgi:taurine dioxygenase